jgi:hypothetical protein
LAGFCEKSIQDFSRIATSLNRLTKKGVQFVWDSDYQQAFQCLKEKVTTAPVLMILRNDQRYVVYTNVSFLGLGGVLMQM